MVWIIGNKGMLGTELQNLLNIKKDFEVTGTDIEIDITNKDTLLEFITNKKINCIVNCAAYTAVDKAEDNADECRLLNTTAVKNITEVAKKTDSYLIHISTDYVFNGKGNIPYKEDDKTDPIGVYGLTKRDGELEVLKYNKSCIIRTAWLYGIHGNNFVKTMIKLMNEKDEIKVINDQKGSPTWTRDLADVIIKLIYNQLYGIFHYTNEGEITWYDFTCKIYELEKQNGRINKNVIILPCTTSEYYTRAKRPAYSVLDKTKIKNTLKINIPLWNESLGGYLAQ